MSSSFATDIAQIEIYAIRANIGGCLHLPKHLDEKVAPPAAEEAEWRN
jgi:S-adenosylhomocysteine hydrolase